ncbi:MAG: T9SS type A sorting domain-containing protein [Bacteroidetes bacterium]|nr:MAG: T9SS type A sorting domain-containing protein [Bacteroidota bacterium]
MKHSLLRMLGLSLSVFLTNGGLQAQGFSPSAILGLEKTYLTSFIDCINIKASGFDYVSVSVTRDANNKITDIYALNNPALEDKEERTQSSFSGNEITYTIEMRDPNNGINSFSTVRTERFYVDQSSFLDTLIIVSQFDALSGQITSVDSNYYEYVGDRLQRIHNAGSTRYSELVYSGNQLDSIKMYQLYQGSIQLWGLQKYNYSSGVLTSIEQFENQGSGLVASGTTSVTQNNSMHTVQFTQSNNVQYKFNENCTPPLGVDEVTSNNDWSIYPNPGQGMLKFSGEIHTSQFFIYSILGELVLRGEVHKEGLDVSKLSSGSYLIEIDGIRKKLMIR